MRYTIALPFASILAVLAPAARAEVPAVVTDIPPIHGLVAMVMGDLGEPVLLLSPGADAHDFQLRPSQAAALQGAGLVVWTGPQMAPWLDRALEGTGAGDRALALLTAPGTELRQYGDDSAHDHADHAEAGDEHDHEGHDHEAHDHDDHEGHSHEGADPHAWLDPHNAEVWVGVIAAELSRLDPANAATYAANAGAAAARIEAAEAEVEATLAPVKDRPFVVFHDAYNYFTGHFGLTVAGTISEGDAASPGAARLRELQQKAAGGGALCIFPEANHDPALASQMAEAAGARVGGALDPEGSALTPGADLYPALLTGLAATIADCLGQQ